MIKGSRIAVIIPIYNEEATLRHLFYRLEGVYKILKDSYDIRFLLIDDGSKDNSRKMMEDKYKDIPHVEILRHGRNLGYGASLKTGFRKALEEGYDYIITVDADTNYDQFLIPHFIYEFNPDNEDILSASPWHRECSKNNFPLFRFILSYSMSLLYQFVLMPECPPLTCYSSCFRLYKKDVVEKVKYASNDFLTNSEIMSLALLAGYRVRELPINVNYRMFGISKMRKYRQILKHFAFMCYLVRNKKTIKGTVCQNAVVERGD